MASATQKHELALASCTPEPLMAYLKALGVFRLVAEQKEQDVLACWRYDTFVLHTSLGRDALMRFFLEEYRPTPIVAPWNGGSGFYKKDNKQGISAILASDDPRLEDYHLVIRQVKKIVASLGDVQKKGTKVLVLAECRNTLPEAVLAWLDAAYVLSGDTPKYPPVLGTGGNDGRLEFSNNFIQNVVSVLGIQGTQVQKKKGGTTATGPEALLEASLFGITGAALRKDRTLGQFAPGSVGGPNATVGFEAESLTNPWDYVLMIEGALLFAGAVARRLSAESRSKAIFPFTVDTSAAGYGTAVDAEYSKAARAEVWAPLWDHPATYREVAHVFAEGRAQLGRGQAVTGADFARAIAGLGVERGISDFMRFGLLMRNGLAYLATPLGRFRVRANPRVDVLVDVDPWLSGLRRLARGQNVPEGLSRPLRQIDQAIMDFCQVRDGQQEVESAHRLQDVLIALGQAEAWLSRSGLRDRPRPLSSLRPEWLKQADDGSAEFRIAAAIASIRGTQDGVIGSVRVNLERVVLQRGRWVWADDNPSVVWRSVELLRDMTAILERRCLGARMKVPSQGDVLPLRGRVSASLADILAFLEGRLDERRIGEMVLSLATIDWGSVPSTLEFRDRKDDHAILPLSYAVLKLLFLPWKLRRGPGALEVEVLPEPSILPLLRADRSDEAYSAAWRRLYVSGFTPLARATMTPSRLTGRLAAALLIPICFSDMYSLTNMALKPTAENA